MTSICPLFCNILPDEIVNEVKIANLCDTVVVVAMGQLPPDLRSCLVELVQLLHVSRPTRVSVAVSKLYDSFSLRYNLVLQPTHKQDRYVPYLGNHDFARPDFVTQWRQKFCIRDHTVSLGWVSIAAPNRGIVPLANAGQGHTSVSFSVCLGKCSRG